MKNTSFYISASSVFFCCVFLCCASILQAKDFGTYGETFVINEQDLFEVIQTKLKISQKDGSLDALNEDFKKKIKHKILNPEPIFSIAKVTKNSMRKFDPTTYLEEDIRVPDDVGGYRTLYPRGTKINPLNYMHFAEPLVFIDARDSAQVDFAKHYLKLNPQAKIILIAGKPGLQKDGTMFYLDQKAIYSSRFGIVAAPSVVFQKEGEKLLTIEERLLP